MYELGRRLIGAASHPPFRDCTGRRMRLYAARHCVPRCSGGDGLTCREPTPQIVADVSPWWGGRASIGALELRPSGARQWPVRRGRRSTAQPRPSQRRGQTTMRHAALRHPRTLTRRPLKRSSEIILATVIYLTASCLAVVGTLGFVAAIWVLWGTLGVR